MTHIWNAAAESKCPQMMQMNKEAELYALFDDFFKSTENKWISCILQQYFPQAALKQCTLSIALYKRNLKNFKEKNCIFLCNFMHMSSKAIHNSMQF